MEPMDNDGNLSMVPDILTEDEAESNQQTGSQDPSDYIAGYDTDQLPPFANEKNKRLHQQVKEKELQLVKIEENIADQKNRLKIMQEHMRSVTQELDHTRALSAVKKQEIDTEKHLTILATKEKHRLTSDAEKINSIIADFTNRINQVRSQTFNINEQMEAFKLKMNWKQEELEQWTIAAKQKQEDRLALEKYKRADDAVIKKLNIELEKSSNECEETKNRLDTEITETKAIQMQLDNAASEFRSLHGQRVDLIKQWDNAVKTIQEKDKNIINISIIVQNQAVIAHDKDDEIKQQAALLEQEKAEHKQAEREIDKLQRSLRKLRDEHSTRVTQVNDKKNEFMLLSSELNKVESDAKKMAGDIDSLEKLEKEFEQNLAKKELQLKNTENQLMKVNINVQDAKNVVQERDSMLQTTQNDLERIIREQSDLKRVLFKKQQAIYEFKKQETSINNDINGTQASIKNLQSKINELDKRATKQEESLYSLDFQIQQLERKVARASGKRTQEEQIELNNKISQLNVQLEEQTRHEKELTQQVKRFNDDLRAAKTRNSQIIKDKSTLETKISECLLHNKSIEHEIDDLKKEEIESLLTRDEQKLNVDSLKDQLKSVTAKLYALENRKVQLQLTIEERNNEIFHLSKMNTALLRSKEQARHDAQMELTECEAKANTLKAKFTTLSGKLRGSSENDDADGNDGKSQVYYMIKIAQEREELQQKGDKLDLEIRKAEKDVKLLYKSLQCLNDGNQMYRDSLHAIELEQGLGSTNNKNINSKSEKQMKHRGNLEAKTRELSNNLYHGKQQMKELKDHAKQLLSQVNLIKSKITEISDDITKYQLATEKLNKKIETQNLKLNRANKNVEKIKNELMQSLPESKNHTIMTRITNEIELRSLRRKEKMIQDMLQHIIVQFPELQHGIFAKLSENNLQFQFKPNNVLSMSIRSSHSETESQSCNLSSIGDDEWMRPSSVASKASTNASQASQTSQASVVNLQLNP